MRMKNQDKYGNNLIVREELGKRNEEELLRAN